MGPLQGHPQELVLGVGLQLQHPVSHPPPPKLSVSSAFPPLNSISLLLAATPTFHSSQSIYTSVPIHVFLGLFLVFHGSLSKEKSLA